VSGKRRSMTEHSRGRHTRSVTRHLVTFLHGGRETAK
jgi:hypothetical protein